MASEDTADKIQISWDEVNSALVDQRLQQQDAMARATQHYQQHVASTPASPSGRAGWSSLWYNSFFYTALFGLVGGLGAWLIGEFVLLTLRTDAEAFVELLEQETAIAESVNHGEISQAAAEALINELYADNADSPYVRLMADETVPESVKRQMLGERFAQDQVRGFVQQLIWFSFLGILISFSLSIGDHVVSFNWRAAIINGSVGILLGLIGGIIVGLFINQFYTALGGGGGDEEPSLVRQIFARGVGWAVLGLFVAIAPGIVLRNLKRCVIGLMGGFAGGLLGGLLFDPVSLVLGTGVVSRLVAIVAIGVVAGLGTGVIESVAKSGWMKVVGGLLTGKQFILYKNPTTIGSSPQCEIYLFKDMTVAPRHAAIQQLPVGYELHDLGTSTGTFVNGARVSRTRLRNNDRIQIGSTVFMFQEKEKS